MHANVLPKACIRCGLCPTICPEVFVLEDGESARAVVDPVPEESQVAAQEAADSCPVDAIQIR